VLLATNTYDELLSYVVFADWLFFGLTAGALFVVRRRGASAADARIARVPGHPWTTLAFVIVAAAVVVNTFLTYPTQSAIGSAVLVLAAIGFAAARKTRVLRREAGTADTSGAGL